MKDEYVVSIKITSDLPVSIKSLPVIIKEQVINGSAVILTLETYEHWKEEQEAK
jgi:hypothetical protein